MVSLSGKIYGLYDTQGKCCYIGSTGTSLATRISCHKTASKTSPNRLIYKHIFENGGWDEFKIVLIEDVEYEFKQTLHRREGDFITKLNPICNQKVAGRTKKEYRQANIERYREYMKLYMRTYLKDKSKVI